MWWWIMYIFLLPPAGPEEAPEEAGLLYEERGAVHRGARLDHPRARPADSCSIHILGTLGRIYSRQWFDLQALRVRCMQIYRADHSSECGHRIVRGIVNDSKYNQNVWLSYEIFHWLTVRASYWRDQSSWNATVNVLLLGPGWLRGLHVPRPRPAPRLGSGRELVRAEDAVAGGDQDVVQPRALQPPAERGAVGHPGHVISYQLHCTISRITSSAYLFTIHQDRTSPVGAAARLVDCREHPEEGLSEKYLLLMNNFG